MEECGIIPAMKTLGTWMLIASLCGLVGLEPRARSQESGPAKSWVVKKIAVEVERTVGFTRSSFGSVESDIFIIDPLGSKPKRLVEGSYPAWSPDGQKVAYSVRERHGFGQVQIINSDGTGQRQLTSLDSGACMPDWSPDGGKLAFNTCSGTLPNGEKVAVNPHSGTLPRIAIVDKNGENLRFLTDGYGPRWSPNGRQLLFSRTGTSPGERGAIWIVNEDGSGLRKVIEDDSSVMEPAWFPDGNAIAFGSRREKRPAIFRTSLDGSGVVKIASDKDLPFFFPVLSPDGKVIIVDSNTAELPQNLRTMSNDPQSRAAVESSVLLFDLQTHKKRTLTDGRHPSILWEEK